jgi:hypothetical protein
MMYGGGAFGAALLLGRLRWCVLCAAFTVVESVQPPCECIDPWEGLADADRSALAASGLTVEIAAERGVTANTATNVPLTYGTRGCDTYDDGLAPTCRNANGEIPPSGRPAWCSSKWCFVNSSACQVRRCGVPANSVGPLRTGAAFLSCVGFAASRCLTCLTLFCASHRIASTCRSRMIS